MSEQVNNVKSCLRCGSELELQKGSYPMGSTLFSQRFHVDIYACPHCGRVELFKAQDDQMIICPISGTSHPAQEKCAICVLNTVLDGKR